MSKWVNTMAVAKAVKDAEAKKVRKNLEVGHHKIENLVVEINGHINVAEDEEYTPTVEIPIKATLALFIRYCGVTRAAATDALVRAMTNAIDADEKGDEKSRRIFDEIKASQEDIDACKQVVDASMMELPKKMRSGKVTSKLEVSYR